MFSKQRRGNHKAFSLFLVFIFLGTSTFSAVPEEEYPNQKDTVQDVSKIRLWPETKQENEQEKMDSHMLRNTLFESYYGRYEISDRRYKEVYQQGGDIFTLEISWLLKAQDQHHLGISLGIKSFTKKGQASITQEETKLRLIPIFFGCKYLFKAGNFIPWIEIGLDWYTYKERSSIKTTSNSTLGYHIQGGLYFQIPKIEFMVLRVYAKHTRAKTEENNIEVNLGGFEYGVGLAFNFNLF
jgi:hypothetical protein